MYSASAPAQIYYQPPAAPKEIIIIQDRPVENSGASCCKIFCIVILVLVVIPILIKLLVVVFAVLFLEAAVSEAMQNVA